MDQIEQVRTKTDIIELINSYIPLKKAGRNFKALCPFHSEKTPSFVVSPERQIFKCFGCGESGSVFNFLMKYENMDFGEALRFLADKAGIKLKSFKPSKAFQEKERLLQVNHLASEFYHFILLNHKVGERGLKYLLGRGISKNSMKLFKLGYAPESWENLQDFLVRKKGYKRPTLEKAGLIIPSHQSFYDRFRGRIIFPLLDHRGNTVGFAGRVIPAARLPSPVAQATGGQAKYINTPETILYHKSDLLYGLNITKKAIKEKNQAIVVEGELDLISSYQAGVKNVVAIKGSALTENQVNLIKRFTENIALSLDEDAAGDAAARRGIEIADSEGLNIRVIQLQYGKDPDECSQHSAKLWKESVKKSIPVYDFYLKSVVKRFGKKSAESKKRISEALVSIWAKIVNEVVKAHYVKKLANLLQVDEEVILKEIVRWEKKEEVGQLGRKKTRSQVRPAEKEKSRREKLEELLLALVLQDKRAKNKRLEKVDEDKLNNNVVKRIFKALKGFMKNKKAKEFMINKFVEKLAEELIETVDRLYLMDLQLDLKKPNEFKQEFEKTLKEFEKLWLKEQLVVLVSAIRKAEKEGKENRLIELRQEFINISQKLKDKV